MTEEFEIQCESCGTIYSHVEEACPYCGQPQPLLIDPDSFLPESVTYEDELLLEEELLAGQHEALTYPAYPPARAPLREEYLYPEDEEGADEAFPAEYPEPEYQPFLEDELAALAGEADQYDEYGQYDELFDPYDDDQEDELEAELAEKTQPRRFTWKRSLLGCLGTLACIGLLYGTIGVIAAYHGLQEHASLTQAEVEAHYQRGQEHLANGAIELAIAELEHALSLNPNFLAAREALREAQRISQSQPTPTSETRSAAAASLLEEAAVQVDQEKWFEAAQTLAQVRDLDRDYQAGRVSELLYTVNYQLGLQLITPDRIAEALLSFERALAERPDDPAATTQQARASLYIAGQTTEGVNQQKAVDTFSQLYQEEPEYLDVAKRLVKAYELWGDELADEEDWCLAETQYSAAHRLQPSPSLQDKVDSSNERCQETLVAQTGSASSPRPAAKVTPAAAENLPAVDRAEVPATATAPAGAAPASRGAILFSAFNPAESRWEILAVPASGGSPTLLATHATMPSVSPDGRWLVYRSELADAEGFHRIDLTTGEDTRITIIRRHILPRWGADSNQFLFVAEEPGTGRWQVHLGFTDGKGDPVILRDGRTPDWSPKGNLIAYQGTDAEGNNPGIYIVPFDGGEATRLTNHESDRTPDFSPDGSQLAYMSTRGGNWDIYTVSTAGGPPRQITNNPGQDGLPIWSPDGSQIAYVSDAGGSWAIYVVNAQGGTPARVTAWDGNNLADWLLTQIWWTR